MEYAKLLLEEVGLGRERIEMYHIGASDAPLWVEKVEEITNRVKKMGPNPIKYETHTGKKEKRFHDNCKEKAL